MYTPSAAVAIKIVQHRYTYIKRVSTRYNVPVYQHNSLLVSERGCSNVYNALIYYVRILPTCCGM